MKKSFILFAFFLLVSAALFAQVKSGSNAWVSSKSVDIRESTGSFAKSRGTLLMGAQVTVLQVNGNWAEVRSSDNASLSGWTAVSNLSSRRIVASGSSATASEIALAGKGFNREVEDSYKTSGALNYTDVDKVEAITIPVNELYKFVTEGHLITGE